MTKTMIFKCQIALKLSIATKAKLIIKTNARMQADMLDVFLDKCIRIISLRNSIPKMNCFCLKTIYFISVTLKLCTHETLILRFLMY